MEPRLETARMPKIPFARFLITTALQLVLAVGLFWLVARSAFTHELVRPGNLAAWVFLLGVPLSCFEYFYHRYLLHSAVLPFLASMHRAHALHHSLTSVKAPVRADDPAMLVTVESEFPIEEDAQTESMMFPPYALSIFYALFLAVLGLPLKLVFPGAPALLAVIVAVTLYYSGYELWHAVTHLPYDRFWRPLMEGRRTRRMTRRAYAFHLMHHWRPSCNLAVVGFWGFALWDHVFRTCHRPEHLPLNEAEVAYADAQLKGPVWPITMLDRWKGSCHRWARKFEAVLARIVLRRQARSTT